MAVGKTVVPGTHGRLWIEADVDGDKGWAGEKPLPMPDAECCSACITEFPKELIVRMCGLPGALHEWFEIEDRAAAGNRLAVTKGDRSRVGGGRIGEVEFVVDFIGVLWGQALKFFERRTARGTQCLVVRREFAVGRTLPRASEGQSDQGCDDVVPEGSPSLAEDDAARSVAGIGTGQLRNSVSPDCRDSMVDFLESRGCIYGCYSLLKADGDAVVISVGLPGS